MLDLDIHDLLTLIHLQFVQPNLLALKSTLSQSLNVHVATSAIPSSILIYLYVDKFLPRPLRQSKSYSSLEWANSHCFFNNWRSKLNLDLSYGVIPCLLWQTKSSSSWVSQFIRNLLTNMKLQRFLHNQGHLRTWIRQMMTIHECCTLCDLTSSLLACLLVMIPPPQMRAGPKSIMS